MSITKEKYEELEAAYNKARREADKAEGSVESLMKDLEKNFGCKTKKEATAKLKLLQKQEAEAEEAYHEAVAEFESKWD